MSGVLYAIAATLGLWLLWAFVEVMLKIREAPSLAHALENPDTIVFRPSRFRPPTLRWGPAAALIRDLEAQGFSVVADVVECAGVARIPAVILVSSDGTTQATVSRAALLPIGMLKVWASLYSRLEDDTFVCTGSSLPTGPGLEVVQPGETLGASVRAHRFRVAQQQSPPRPVDVDLRALEAFSRDLYRRRLEVMASSAGPPVALSFVDGRDAAERAGLSVADPPSGLPRGFLLGLLLLLLALGWSIDSTVIVVGAGGLLGYLGMGAVVRRWL